MLQWAMPTLFALSADVVQPLPAYCQRNSHAAVGPKDLAFFDNIMDTGHSDLQTFRGGSCADRVDDWA